MEFTRSKILEVHPEVQESRDSKKILKRFGSKLGGELEKRSRDDEDVPEEKEDSDAQVAEIPESEEFEFDESVYEELALLGIEPPESGIKKQMMYLWYQLAFTPNTSSILQQLCEFEAPYELFAKYEIQSEVMRYWENEHMQPEISVVCHRIETMKPKKKHCRNLKKQWQKMVRDGDDDSFGPSDASDTSGSF